MGGALTALSLTYCDSFGGESSPSTSDDDDGGQADDASNEALPGPEPEPLDPGTDGPPLPPLPEGGCMDAALSESFDTSFLTSWSTTASDGGSVALDVSAAVSPPSSLRAQVSSAPSGFAFAGRRTCPATGVLACTFSLRVDTVADGGDIGIVDLRGKANGGGYAVARVKARELMFLTPGEAGQQVDRTPIDLLSEPRGQFRKMDIELTSSTLVLKVEGKVLGAMSVPAAGFSLEEVRTGVLYMSGARTPGWDLRIDDLGCAWR